MEVVGCVYNRIVRYYFYGSFSTETPTLILMFFLQKLFKRVCPN